MLYFAYGSNMSRGPMLERCPNAKEAGRGVLQGHRFVIMANGYASVVPASGQDVHGILWTIDAADLVALDDYEDVAGGLYRKAMLPVFQHGKSVEALVYLGCEMREGRPGAIYMSLVVAAARDCGLPEDYISSLAGFEPGET
jgi:gamma-glutamylcyclotransferase (GGCT)/AIG2-like uncharacterized protein YtfP